MASKRSASSALDVKRKRSRKSLSLEAKLDIIKRREKGQRITSIARSLGIPLSTVSTVLQKSKEIKKDGKTSSNPMAKRLTRRREPIMVEMERLLKLWVDDQARKRMPLSNSLICTKALSIYGDLHKNNYPTKDGTIFVASKGWFERFKHRAALNNVELNGSNGVTDSSDSPGTKAFKHILKNRIKEGGYSAKQVLNFDTMGLYWKRMSSKTFIYKEEKTASGFKASKDRATLLVGGNAAGDLKLKPMLIYHSETPRALKGYIKEHLPVIWKANKKCWMTIDINQSYFISYLSPMLRDYAAKNHLANRFLLILDNAPCNPSGMEDWTDNIEVLFIPANITAIIKPMEQGVIASLKAFYQRRVMKQLIDSIDIEINRTTIKQFWSNYNIRKAIENINASWKEVTDATMNGCWENVWQECVQNEFTGFSDVTNVRKDIVRLSHIAGFDEVDDNDVQELLDSHDDPLSNDDLMALDQERAFDDEEDQMEIHRGLDLTNLCKFFKGIEQSLDLIKDCDPNPARSAAAADGVQQALKVYREIFDAKKNLARGKSFFKSAATPNSCSSPTSGSSSDTAADNPTPLLSSDDEDDKTIIEHLI